MRRIKPIYKIAAIFCLLGTLFFSCTLATQDDFGTVVLSLPGSGFSRGVVSGTFTSTLSYFIRCTGSGTVTRTVHAGTPVEIRLNAGNWDISVTVLNAAGEMINGNERPESASVTVEGGKTVNLRMPITIDTSRNAIRRFAITSPVSVSVGGNDIDHDGGQGGGGIVGFTVPFGTDLIGMNYSMVHTGRSVKDQATSEPVETQGQRHFNWTQEFVVTAENGDDKGYAVMADLDFPAAFENDWPDDVDQYVWGNFGFTEDLNNPIPGFGSGGVSCTVINYGTEYKYMAVLFTCPSLDFKGFTDAITRIVDVKEVIVDDTASKIFKIRYQGYGDNYILTFSQYGVADQYYLVIKTDFSDYNTGWPASNIWALYGLSGFTQPSNTSNVYFIENDMGSFNSLSVILFGTADAYEYMKAQIAAKYTIESYIEDPFNCSFNSGWDSDLYVFGMLFMDTESNVIVLSINRENIIRP